MDSLVFLGEPDSAKLQPLYVVHGDEDFLKRQALAKLRRMAFGNDPDVGPVVVEGETAKLADVFDELETVGFFTARRMVIVDDADPFVSEFRAQLEKRIGQLTPTGILVLAVKSWPATTRLAKMVPASATIVCKSLPPGRLVGWCQEWSFRTKQKQLPESAAGLLVELVGPDLGLLDQELEKLSLYVGKKERIEARDVDRLVGHSRAENVFKIFDLAVEGRMADALTSLERLFERGEDAMRLIGAFGFQLRKLAQADRYIAMGRKLLPALEEAGVTNFALKSSENLLRHLGRRRAGKLYDWLMEINMGMRGDSALPERTLLERLIVRIGMKNPVAG